MSSSALMFQLLIQTRHMYNPIKDPGYEFNSNFAPDYYLDDGCDLNIFEEDTCVERSDLDHPKFIQKRSAIKCRKWLWPDRTVPYKLVLDDPSIVEKFRQAIDDISAIQCVKFREIIDQSEIEKLASTRLKYLTVTEIQPLPGRSCQASLGAIGQNPRMHLSYVCSKGHILHELMHVLGFVHEHQRPDRDRYVRIRCDRIMPNVSQDFRRLKMRVTTQFDDDDQYDFRSIMHYRLDHFSVDGQRTLEPADPEYLETAGIKEDEIGRMNKLSDTDIRRMRKLYEC